MPQGHKKNRLSRNSASGSKPVLTTPGANDRYADAADLTDTVRKNLFGFKQDAWRSDWLHPAQISVECIFVNQAVFHD